MLSARARQGPRMEGEARVVLGAGAGSAGPLRLSPVECSFQEARPLPQPPSARTFRALPTSFESLYLSPPCEAEFLKSKSLLLLLNFCHPST